MISSIDAQTSLRKTLRLNDALSTDVDFVEIDNDKILISGFNFYGGSGNQLACLLDTNLNVINYIDFSLLDPEIVGGDIDLIFTDDSGYLIAKQTFEDSVSYSLSKYNEVNELEWYKKVYSKDFRGIKKIIETDTSYLIVGRLVEAIEGNFDDLIYKVFVDKISKLGEYEETNILFEKKAYMNVADAIIDDGKFIVSYVYSSSFNASQLYVGTNVIVEYDGTFNEIDSWEGVGFIESINLNEDGYYFTSAWIDDPGFSENIPRHIVGKLSLVLELEWTQDYLYPPFYNDPDFFGTRNILQAMWPDSRGGFYIVGDLLGHEGKFQTPPNSEPIGPYLQGTSLIKIDEDGNELWQYKDPYGNMAPRAAATLSSGNILIVGEGFVFDEDGLLRETLTAIKLDKDGCHQSGCREDVGLEDLDIFKIEISPNPSDGIYFVETENESITEVSIYKISGERVHFIHEHSNRFEIDISSMPAAIYIAKFKTKDNRIITKRLVKK